MQILSYNAYAEGSPYPARFPATRQRLVGSLDLFLRFLGSREPLILEQVSSKLLDRMRGFTEEEDAHRSPAILAEVVQEYPSAEEHHDLLRAQFTLQHELLGVEEKIWISEGTVEIPQAAFFRALYVPQYLALKALVDVLGRPRGIELMRSCLDWAYAQGPDHPNAPKTIAELRTRQAEGNIRGKGMDWIAAVISEHEYRNKVTVCAIQKALANYGNSELMEVVACYPDFTIFRKVNPSFCLTRTQTLMGGGDCCDMCYHDERYVSDFVHPSAEVFDAMKVKDAS